MGSCGPIVLLSQSGLGSLRYSGGIIGPDAGFFIVDRQNYRASRSDIIRREVAGSI
jgi:hypothetical protein